MSKEKLVSELATLRRRIAALEAKERQLFYLATHDILTGVRNQALFNDHLTWALQQARHNQRHLAVMLIDLDGFKDVNDTFGHSGRDELLRAVGDRLKNLLHKSDTIARVEGDEFLVLLPEITEVEDIATIALRILAAFQKSFVCNHHEISITTTIGIATYPTDGENVDTLVKNADIAMYGAKNKGPNNYQCYTSPTEIKARQLTGKD